LSVGSLEDPARNCCVNARPTGPRASEETHIARGVSWIRECGGRSDKTRRRSTNRRSKHQPGSGHAAVTLAQILGFGPASRTCSELSSINVQRIHNGAIACTIRRTAWRPPGAHRGYLRSRDESRAVSVPMGQTTSTEGRRAGRRKPSLDLGARRGTRKWHGEPDRGPRLLPWVSPQHSERSPRVTWGAEATRRTPSTKANPWR